MTFSFLLSNPRSQRKTKNYTHTYIYILMQLFLFPKPIFQSEQDNKSYYTKLKQALMDLLISRSQLCQESIEIISN